jgi:PAS domain S-box-containing protein
MKKVKILYVEDNKGDQTSFRYFMKDLPESFDLTIADTIKEAKQFINKEIFDIVLCDHFLGDGTSFDILELKQEIPIIVITGVGNGDIQLKAIKMGAKDYFIKDGDFNYLKVLPLAIENILKNNQTEIALKETEEQIQSIFKNAPAAVIMIDDEGKIVRWNPKAETIFGWPEDEVIDKFMHEIIFIGKDREEFLKIKKQCLEANENDLFNKAIELIAVNKAHSNFPIEVSISPTIVNGKSFLILFIYDISCRKKTHEDLNEKSSLIKNNTIRINEINDALLRSMQMNFLENIPIGEKGDELDAIAMGINILQEVIEMKIRELKTEEEKFRRLMEAATDAIVIVNSHGKIKLVNKQTQNLFGYTTDELIGNNVEMLIPLSLKHKHQTQVAHFLAHSQARPHGTRLDLFGKHKNGIEIPVEISLSHFESSEGILVFATIMDISEQKKIRN